MSTPHPLLARQLSRMELRRGRLPTLKQWQQFLGRVHAAYESNDQDRALLERSLTISSEEMRGLYDELRETSRSQLAHERNRLGAVIDALGDGLCVLDAAGSVVRSNPAADALMAAEPGALSGTELLLPSDDPPLAEARKLVYVALRTGVPVRVNQAWFLSRANAKFPVSFVVNPLSATGGAVLVFRDIAERIAVEEKLNAYATRLERSNKELQDFAYVASHDLQEPLRKIQAFCDRLPPLLEGNTSETALDYLSRVAGAAARMQELINDLLDFSRVSRSILQDAPAPLQAIVQDAVGDLDIRIEQSGAIVQVDELPIVSVDASLIRQVFQNLISNALKFARPGIAPRVHVFAQPAPAGYVQVCIADNGIGFEPRFGERIFEIFQRLHGRGQYAGTGIGLAVCRRIVERHGGSIRAESAPGAGATFVIMLPRRPASQASLNAPAATP